METALSVPGTSPLGPRFARQTAGGGGTFWGQTYFFASWFPLSKLEITYRGETFLYMAVQYVRPLNVPRPSLSYGLSVPGTSPLGPRFSRQTAGGGGTFWGQTYYFASWFPLSKLEITYRGETFLYVAVQYVRPLNVPRPSLSYGLITTSKYCRYLPSYRVMNGTVLLYSTRTRMDRVPSIVPFWSAAMTNPINRLCIVGTRTYATQEPRIRAVVSPPQTEKKTWKVLKGLE